MSIIVAKEHKALVVPDNPATINVFPGVPRLDDGRFVVQHSVQNTKLLRHMGYEVPSPILTHYDWPYTDGEPPFEVQLKSATMLSENPRAYCLNDKGTGKTRTALWAWDFLNRSGAANKLLVVCDKSNLFTPWRAEAFVLFPQRKVSVLYGSNDTATKKQRLAALDVDADIYIINHDGMRVIRKELLARTDIDTLVIDELAVYRNFSDRNKTMKVLADRFKIVWGLTGSPMPQEPTDVWGQARIITPWSVPAKRKACKEMLMMQMSQFVWRPKADAVEKAYSMLQPNVRYTLSDVVELPELVERSADIALSKQQALVYDNMRKDMLAIVEDKTIKGVNQGVVESKLTQIAGGWVYTQNPEFKKLDASPRVTQLIDDINSAAHKVLVFVPFRAMINGIAEEFERQKVPFQYVMVHGDTKDRHEIFTKFQDDPDSWKVMLCDPTTVHHGITLTAADTGIWYVPISSFEKFDQANGRFRRYSQKHKQLLLMYQGSPCERKMYSRLRSKERLQTKLLDLLEEATERRDQKNA